MKLYIRKIEDYKEADTDLLEKARRTRLARIKNPKVRTECIAAGMLLREALADYGYPVGDTPLSIRYDEHGKPELSAQADDPDNCKTAPYFSLSHSGDIVVCAVDDEPIGADVQVVKAVTVRLPKKVLADNELEEYLRIKETKQDQEAALYFTIRWTEKESIAKLIGKGIGLDFKTIEPKDYTMHTIIRSIDREEYVITTAQYK